MKYNIIVYRPIFNGIVEANNEEEAEMLVRKQFNIPPIAHIIVDFIDEYEEHKEEEIKTEEV